MNKPSKLTLWIIIAIFALALVYLITYVSVNDVDKLRLQVRVDKETIENLEDLVERKDFAWTACDMEVDNLEQIIASKDELILELRVKEEILKLYKKTLEYTCVWVIYADKLLDTNGISHFEYIGDTILEDDYLDDIEEQIRWFDYVESGVKE